MTQVQIVNLGLQLISQRVIQTMNDNTVEANASNNVWIPCLQECLRGNNWSFAQVIELAVASSPAYTPLNYLYAYKYPANAMAVWKVYNAYTADMKKGEDFREVYDAVNNQRVILTNCQNAYIEYTYYVTDTTMFDPSFVTMLSYRLAAALAMPLNADSEQAKEMTAVFANQMSEAQRMSSYENNIDNGQNPDAIVLSRMSGINGSGTSIGGVTFDQFNRGQ